MLALVDIVPGVPGFPTSLISCHLLKHLTNQKPSFAMLTNQTPSFDGLTDQKASFDQSDYL